MRITNWEVVMWMQEVQQNQKEWRTDRRGIEETSLALSIPSLGLKLRSAVFGGIIYMDLEHRSSSEGGATINALGRADGFDSLEWLAHECAGDSNPARGSN